ncbi:hypothetical protein GCM10022280_17530 [Sphingomonas swuensis]|uniref:Uncharacterized protein n=1 Tax=Sphingomonas swuensis TaxID=977800 RepID=A0ABP7SZ29_9SPHN
MADNKSGLPEGTDTVIEGGGMGRTSTTSQGHSPSTTTSSTGGRTTTPSGDSQTDALITGSTGSSGSSGSAGSSGSSGSAGSSGSSGSSGSDGSSGGIRGMVGNVTTKARDEAANRARGFVGEGLKSGSTTLGSIAGIIEETVDQIGEKLGPQYGDYARSASQSIQRYATTLENKNPDELVDDARAIIRKSPAVAITGAAILGFGLVRLLKAGIPQEGSNGTRDRQSDRTGSTR